MNACAQLSLRLVLPRSTCSVELKNGVFASILIADDPNYFQE